MRQIHQVVESSQMEWVLDPVRGPIKQSIVAMKKGGTERIVFGTEHYELAPDGTFHVSNECADYYLRMPGWHEGASPFPPEDMVRQYEESRHEPRIERVADASGDPAPPSASPRPRSTPKARA